MPKTTDGRIALAALISFTAWLFVGLPLIYEPAGTVGFWGWLSKDASGFFTFLLLIVAAVQLGLFWYQLRLIRVSLDEAKTAARAAADAASASARQADAAEQSLAKIERPYLFIFNVSKPIIEASKSEGDPRNLAVTYTVANYGKIPAVIEDVRAELSILAAPVEPTVVGPDHPLEVSPILASSDERPEIRQSIPWSNFLIDADLEIPSFGAGKFLFLWVTIAYRGPFTSGHKTDLCWRYDEQIRAFVHYQGEKKRINLI